MDSPETQIALLQADVSRAKEDINDIKATTRRIEDKLDNRYVSKDDFLFWRNALVGMVSAALVMSFGLLLDLLFKINKF